MRKLHPLYSLILFIFIGNLQAQSIEHHLGGNRYVSGLLSSKFRYYRATQESSNWCWAACAQMVLAYQGMEVTQKAIVVFTLDDLSNKPANCEMMTSAVNGWGDSDGNNIKAFSKDYLSESAMSKDLIKSLEMDRPVVVGLDNPGGGTGHCYVLTAIAYYMDSEDQKDPFRVVLQDPWPTNPAKVEISWDEFYDRVNCNIFVINKKK